MRSNLVDLIRPPYVLSHSEYRTWKACRRRWYLTYHRRLGLPPDQETVHGLDHLGTAVHLALEGHYGHGLDADRVLIAHYADLIERHSQFIDALQKEREYARTMVYGYLQWAEREGVDEEYEVVTTEGDVSVPITIDEYGQQVILRGRLDVVVRRRHDQALLFQDYKTVGSLLRGQELKRDEQLRFYALLQYLLARVTDEDTDGALYTMLLRSKRTARATPPFYATIHVSYNEHDHASMYARVSEVALEIRYAEEKLLTGGHRRYLYPNPGSACQWCPFEKVCDLADDGSRFEDSLNELYVTIDPMGHYANDRIGEVKELLAGH